MSGPLGSSQWMYATDAGFYPYNIDQSLRFNDNDSPALSKAYSTAQTNTKKLTISVWVKRANLGIRTTILYANSSGTAGKLSFQTTDKLYFNAFNTGYNGFESNAVFRDTSAWYHILAQADSETQTGANINRVYVNGVLLENSKTSIFVPDDTATVILRNGVTTYVGDDTGGAYHFDGYLAEMHVIDGSVVAHTEFGETSNGVWVPKSYSGSYGNNGFYLSFADSSAIGDDLSGNTNDWTANNLAASDVVPDSPTNNFATLNPLQNSGGGGTWYAQATLSEGNLKASLPANSVSVSGMKGTGKLYAEVRWSTVVNELALGLIIPEEYTTTSAHPINTGPNSWRMAYHGYSPADIYLVDEGTSVANPAQTVSAGDIFQVAWDTDNGNIWFGYNNSWYDSSGGTTGNPSTGANATMTATTADLEASLVYIASGNATGVGVINFGQDSTFAGAISAGGNADGNGIGDFAYAPPTGFLALCSANLPELDIGPNSEEQADDYFNTVLYTGNGTSQSITGVGHQPDFIWYKCRSNARDHGITDVVRGVQKTLRPSNALPEVDVPTITSFDSDGFSVGSNALANLASNTFVAWSWKAGGTAASNTDGSITSSVSANQDAGFSIVSFTGTGANATVGHGLSSAPEMIILKNRIDSVNWLVGSTYNPSGWQNYLNLNGTTSALTASTIWQDTAPTSSVFSIGNNPATNGSGDATIAYCFHSVDGFSKVGKYTGNGNADGTFIYTGFRPAWVILKSSSASSPWLIIDNARDINNEADKLLRANTNGTETSNADIDFVSNGFKYRGASSNSSYYYNVSGATYIYLAFAEAPFKYANAR